VWTPFRSLSATLCRWFVAIWKTGVIDVSLFSFIFSFATEQKPLLAALYKVSDFFDETELNKQNIGLRIRKAIFKRATTIHLVSFSEMYWLPEHNVLFHQIQNVLWLVNKVPEFQPKNDSSSPWDNVALNFQGCKKRRQSYVLPCYQAKFMRNTESCVLLP